MARKTKEILSALIDASKELEEAKIKADELDKKRLEAIEEEKLMVEDLKERIVKAASDKGMFCGIILTPELVSELVKQAIENHGNIKIPFELYFEE